MRRHRPRVWARYWLSVASICAVATPLSAARAQQGSVCDPPPDAQTAANTRVVSNVAAAITDQPGGTDRRIDICTTNRETAPKTAAVQSGITVVTTTGFTSAIMGRLDSVRGGAAAAGALATLASLGDGTDGMMALGAKEKRRTAQPGPASPLTAYVTGTFLGGSSDDAPNLAGFSYDSTSGMVGVEYSLSRNLILGLAGSFTSTNADLTTGATMDAGAIQGAAYLSYATKQWFVDALAAYGAVDLESTRPVQTETVRSSTDAGMVALAARGGYLFDLGKLRVGPIAGLTYIHARIDGYTEEGNPDLTLTVGAQTIESLTGSAGVRLLAPFQTGGHLVIPYLNVTLEHQFGDGTQVLAASLSQSGAPVPLSFPAFDARDFGKIEGGITIELAPEASVSLSGASTFARDDGHDFRISTGLNYRF